MLISHQFQFIYIKTRKTAGTSLEFGLTRYMGPNDVITPYGGDDVRRFEFSGRAPQNYEVSPSRWRARDWVKAMAGKRPKYSPHSPAYVVHRYLPDDAWQGYFKFTFERNPWDLAVSAYHWFQRDHSQNQSFTEFVFSDALANYSNWRLYTIRDKVVVDSVYRYDQMRFELERLSQRIGLPDGLELPRENSTSRLDRRPYWDVYHEPERQRVAEVFRMEIAEFGWRFGE